jgi:hypothetical protein
MAYPAKARRIDGSPQVARAIPREVLHHYVTPLFRVLQSDRANARIERGICRVPIASYMKIILYLSDSVPRLSSEADAEVESAVNILKDSRAERILLFGLCSPAGDQLHVVAIRASRANEVAWIDERS